ncbi:hypothetical protein ACVWU4_000911 [Campylobacter coli]
MYFFHNLGNANYTNGQILVYDKARQEVIKSVTVAYGSTSVKSPFIHLRTNTDTVYMYQGVWSARRVFKITCSDDTPVVEDVPGGNVAYCSSSYSIKMTPTVLNKNDKFYLLQGQGDFENFKQNAAWTFKEATLNNTGGYTEANIVPTEQPATIVDSVSKKVLQRLELDKFVDTDFDNRGLVNDYDLKLTTGATYTLISRLKLFFGKANTEVFAKYITRTGHTDYTIVFSTNKTLNFTTASDFDAQVPTIPDKYVLGNNEIKINLKASAVYSPSASNNLGHALYPDEVTGPDPLSTYGGCLFSNNNILNIIIQERGEAMQHNLSKITFVPVYKTYVTKQCSLTGIHTNKHNEIMNVMYSDVNNTGNTMGATSNSQDTWTKDNPMVVTLDIPFEEHKAEIDKILKSYFTLATSYLSHYNYAYAHYRVLELGENPRYLCLCAERTNHINHSTTNVANTSKFFMFRIVEDAGVIKKLELVDYVYGKEVFIKGKAGIGFKYNNNEVIYIGNEEVVNVKFDIDTNSILVSRFNITAPLTAGMDKEGRFYFKPTSGTHELLLQALPNSVDVQYLDPRDSYIPYNGTSFDKQVKVVTKDIYGNPIKAVAELTIAGDNCKFKKSSSNVMRADIPDNGELLVDITIDGPGDISIKADILYDGELSTIKG